MTNAHHTAARVPEELADLWIARAAAQDLEGLVALYAPDAVVQFGDGPPAVGHDAIRAAHAPLVAEPRTFPLGRRLPTLVCGDVALCGATAEGRGRTQVARRRPDGTWVRILDRPNP
jgi:ketosteroid isomerase-like protein